MATVELKGVEKTYRGGFTLRGLSFEVAEGECLALVGPSGCGKTTTLRLIAGLERPTRGAVRIGGRDVTGEPPDRRGVAMVFQSAALYPHMKVRENLALAPRLRGVDAAEVERRIMAAAAMLRIEGLLGRRPGELSGGERQRAAVAKAVVSGAGVLLFDEPLSGLDLPLRGAARADLKGMLARLGVTSIYVTHDQEEAMTLGARVGVMQGGELRQIGPGREVFEDPADRFVAGFIGTPPMSFVEGRLEGGEGSLRFVEGDAPGAVRLGVAAAHGARLAGWAGRGVVLGLRAGAVRVASAARAGRGLEARVEVVEPLGEAANVIAATAGGSRLSLRVAGEGAPGAGEVLRLEADVERAYYFEPGATGRNLLA